MRIFTKSTIIAIVLIAMACKPGMIAYDAKEQKRENYNELLTYSLPMSLLKIKVPVEKKELKKGLIDEISGKKRDSIVNYLYQNYGWEPTKEPKEIFGLGEKIQFLPETRPDPNKIYTVAYRTSKSVGQTASLKINKDGIISSGEFAQENKTFEYVTKGVELLATAAGAFYSLGVDDKQSLLERPSTDPKVNRMAKLIEEANDLAKARTDLIKGLASGVPTSEPTAYRIKLIDERIKEIKNEILGYHKTTTHWVSLLYEPKRDDVVLLELIESKGIRIPKVKSDDRLQGILNEAFGNKDTVKTLKIKATRLSNEPVVRATPKNKSLSAKEEVFLRYNIPAKYRLELLFDGKPLKSFADSEDKKGTDTYTMYFPQFGTVGVLPAKFKDMTAVFYEDTGALKEIKFTKAATSTATEIQASYAALDSIISLREKYLAYKESKKAKDEEPADEEVEETVIRLIIEDGDVPVEK